MAPLSAPGLTARLPLRSPDLSCWAGAGWETCSVTPGGLTGCCSVLQLQPVLPPGAPVLVSQQDTRGQELAVIELRGEGVSRLAMAESSGLSKALGKVWYWGVRSQLHQINPVLGQPSPAFWDSVSSSVKWVMLNDHSHCRDKWGPAD